MINLIASHCHDKMKISKHLLVFFSVLPDQTISQPFRKGWILLFPPDFLQFHCDLSLIRTLLSMYYVSSGHRNALSFSFLVFFTVLFFILKLIHLEFVSGVTVGSTLLFSDFLPSLFLHCLFNSLYSWI